MTNEDQLDAFITATNERLDRIETKLDSIVKSLTLPPGTIERLEAKLAEMRKFTDEPETSDPDGLLR